MPRRGHAALELVLKHGEFERGVAVRDRVAAQGAVKAATPRGAPGLDAVAAGPDVLDEGSVVMRHQNIDDAPALQQIC